MMRVDVRGRNKQEDGENYLVRNFIILTLH